MPGHFLEGGGECQKVAIVWATFSSSIFVHLHLNKQLQRHVVAILKYQNQPDVDVMDFQIEL
jgi:hypothetical protein